MTLVAEADQRRIADAITEAERTTSGEIVAMITPESASYLHVPFLWAALAALALPWPFVFWTWWPIQHIYVLQLATFAVLVGVLMPTPVRMALVPRSVKHARAHRRAVEQFLAQNLHTTVDSNGKFVVDAVSKSGATRLHLTGTIAGHKAHGQFVLKSRFNSHTNRPDKNGSIKCSTGKVTWSAALVG